MRNFLLIHAVALAMIMMGLPDGAKAEEIRLATWNIENWREHFDAREVADWAKTLPKTDLRAEVVRQERNQNDEDNWEIAEVLKHPQLRPDVVVFQEGCSQDDLDYFNKRWMNNAFETAKVFASNTNRTQNVGIMLKKGFEIVETRNEYYLDKDSVYKKFLVDEEGGVDNAAAVTAAGRQFARGPAFVKIKTPTGYTFWVGTNHQKSKYGNNIDVAKWRLREAARTHDIIKDLAAGVTERSTKPASTDGTKTGGTGGVTAKGQAAMDDVVFGGDMNDELGYQEFELQAGGDAIDTLVGHDGAVLLATRPLIDKGDFSFGGYWRPDHRSLIDHWFITPGLKDRVSSVSVFKEGLAPVASDHYPVLLVIRSK